MTTFPGAALVLAPIAKQGYTAYPSPQQKEGFVLHSMVGAYAAAEGRLLGPDQASWHFSVLKDGSVKQHFTDLRTVAWHCGGPGDANPLSAAVGNVALIGIEHEGGSMGNVSEPLTAPQLAATIAVQRWCYTQLPELKSPELHASHWEHRWLAPTACPSSRIPWGIIIPALEGDMYEQADRDRDARIEVMLNKLSVRQVVVTVPGHHYIYEIKDGALVHGSNKVVADATWGVDWDKNVLVLDKTNPDHQEIFRMEARYPDGIPAELGGTGS